MEFYLFSRSEFDRIYNCSVLNDKEWDLQRERSLPMGLFGIVTGLIYLVAYIPCLIVMLRRDLIKYSCYKLMFYLGVMDCLAIQFSCILSGIFSLMGTLACPHYTKFQYISTSFSLGIWCSECLTCAVLALNRCGGLWRAKCILGLFSGRRTYCWIGLCMLYLVGVAFFGRGFFFSSKMHAWFSDPYVDINVAGVPNVDHKQYANIIHTVNNFGVIVVLFVLNAALLLSLYWIARTRQTAFLGKMQRRITYQVCGVCFINFCAASVYAFMQLFAIPRFIVIFGQITWQLSTGLAPFVYLTVNPTIRNGVVELIKPSIIDPLNRIISSYSSALEQERKTTESTPIHKFFVEIAKYDYV